LKYDACFNAYAAGYILRLTIAQSGGDVWEGMGRYHSSTPALKAAYQQRLAAHYGTQANLPTDAEVTRRRQLQNERLASATGASDNLIRGRLPMR